MIQSKYPTSMTSASIMQSNSKFYGGRNGTRQIDYYWTTTILWIWLANVR